ncbi:hypothetical protein [Pilimelia columellifera]|uniref:Uncharacterized protein n=1 Tax=Pilimelia columellifera subsp. columellifera TaxID=706583 RepID=A0ABN3MZ21_9ACTN
MSKSKPTRAFGRRAGGTVTVIEAKVHRSSARRALLAFYLTGIGSWLLFALIMADRWHPIAASIAGAAVGLLSGSAAWVAVRIWPVIVRIWWWLPEILLTAALGFGFVALVENTNLPTRIAVVIVLVAVPAAIPVSRRFIVSWAWCLVIRHRLRVCFTAFIISNQQGSLPLILWALPTPVGVRCWVYLRPGLALADLHGRLDKIAVTCWSDAATVERASTSNAAYVRLDIKRNRVLGHPVSSPLADLLVDEQPTTTAVPAEPAIEPSAVNLADVTTPPVPPAPTQRATPAKPGPNKPTTADSGPGDDIADWI